MPAAHSQLLQLQLLRLQLPQPLLLLQLPLQVGRLLLGVCRVVPGGVVAFFPSFAYLEQLLAHWGGPGSGMLTSLNMRKRVRTAGGGGRRVCSVCVGGVRDVWSYWPALTHAIGCRGAGQAKPGQARVLLEVLGYFLGGGGGSH